MLIIDLDISQCFFHHMPDRGYAFYKKCVISKTSFCALLKITATLQQRITTFVHKVNWESLLSWWITFFRSFQFLLGSFSYQNEWKPKRCPEGRKINQETSGWVHEEADNQPEHRASVITARLRAPSVSRLRITSRCRTSRTPAAIPRPPPPPRPPPRRLPCPAAPRPPLPCILPPSRRGSRSSSTWQVLGGGAGISNLSLFFCTFDVKGTIHWPP